MASEHVVGDVVEHLRPVDDPAHGLIRRFSSSVIALIVEGSRDVGGHRFWNPEELVGVCRGNYGQFSDRTFDRCQNALQILS